MMIRLLSVVIAVVLLQFQIQNIFFEAPRYDESYNASVGKNWMFGPGYASTYDKAIFFNPEVTTGPVMLMPVGILMKAFGFEYWIPRFVGVLCIWTLMLLCFRLLWRTQMHPKHTRLIVF